MIDFAPYVNDFKSAIENTWLTPRGIVFSEGFALCSLINHFDVDLVIESGVAYGGSTSMMASITQKPIFAIDTFNEYVDSYDYASKRLKQYENVKLIKGDSLIKIPEILDAFKGDKIGVFIDGPKGLIAVQMAHALYLNEERVKFICIHDIKYGSQEQKYCSKLLDNVVYTDNPNGKFHKFQQEIDLHMLEINKNLCKQGKSSLDPEDGLGYLQTLLKESPYGFGMAIITKDD